MAFERENKGDPDGRVFETDGVFRRDGGSAGWTEFGVARRSRRTARATMGARGPIARPDVDEGVSRRDADENRARRVVAVAVATRARARLEASTNASRTPRVDAF